MLDKKNRINKEERAVLVGVVHKDQSEQEVLEYLDELSFLAETAGAVTVKKFIQKLAHPDSRTFVGKGKWRIPLKEVAEQTPSCWPRPCFSTERIMIKRFLCLTKH